MKEQQGTFYLQDSQVCGYTELANFSARENDVVGFFEDAVDGLVHNHLYDSPFSKEDKDNMLPNYIYVLITPNEVFAMKNEVLLICNSL